LTAHIRIRPAEIIGREKCYLAVMVSEKRVRKIHAMAYDIRRGRRLGPGREWEGLEGRTGITTLDERLGRHRGNPDTALAFWADAPRRERFALRAEEIYGATK